MAQSSCRTMNLDKSRSKTIRAHLNSWCWPLVLATTLCILANCSSLAELPEQFDQVVSTQAAADQSEYSQAVTTWTRTGSIYCTFSTELLITTTYHSLSFRRAYVVAYARAYHLNEDQKEDLWRDHLSQAERFHEFLLAAYVPESEWNDFANPRSSWKLYLETDGRVRLSPVDIRHIRKVTPLVTSFYPYIQPWERIYKVRFATRVPGSGEPFPGPGDQTLSLLVTNPRGTSRLVWKVESAEAPPQISPGRKGDGTPDLNKDQTANTSQN